MRRSLKFGKALDPVRLAIQEQMEAEVPLFVVMATRLNCIPLFGQHLLMVFVDLINHCKLGNDRHVYTLVFWRSENDLPNIPLMDPLSCCFKVALRYSFENSSFMEAHVEACANTLIRFGNKKLQKPAVYELSVYAPSLLIWTQY